MSDRRRSLRNPLLVVALLCSWSLLASAQESAPSPNPPEQGYPVTVEGHEVFRIFEPVGPFSASDRAEKVSERLRKLAYAPNADVADLKANPSDYSTEIKLGDAMITVVTDDDAKRMHVSRALLAKYCVDQIRNTLNLARQEHSAKYLIRAAIYAIVTLAIYLVLVWLVVVSSRWLIRRLQRPGAVAVKGIKIQKSEILGGERIAELMAAGVRFLRAALLFILTYVLLATEFNYFPWTREHGQQLLAYVSTPVRFVGMAFLNYLPKLFYIAVIVFAMYYVLKLVRVLAREFHRGNIRIRGFYPEWVEPTHKIIRILLFAFTAVLIYPYLPGENSPAFKGVGIFLGVLVSLGSTSAVANVVAGIILTYTRGFRAGDWVKIGDNVGEIMAQTMLATHMQTFWNEEIIIPNSVVLNSHVINYSMLAKDKGLALHTSVTIGYDAPWRTVHKLLIEAALKTEFILAHPEPFVLQSALQDSYVQYQINAFTDKPREMLNIYSALHSNIQDCFFAAGVEIMSPVFSAIRDGNRTAMPAQYLPPDYRPQGFRIATDDAKAKTAGGSKEG